MKPLKQFLLLTFAMLAGGCMATLEFEEDFHLHPHTIDRDGNPTLYALNETTGKEA